MNIRSTMSLYAGGPGSGPNAPCPQCGPHHGPRQVGTSGYREGDRVKLMAPLKTFNEKTWDSVTHEPGTIATVLNVLPKTGNNPEMLKVKVGKHGSEEYVTSASVVMHKAKSKLDTYPGRGVRSKPIDPKRRVSQSKLPEGGRYGVAKPQGEPKGSRGVRNLSSVPHKSKGQFDLTETVSGFASTKGHEGQNLRSFVYEAPGTIVWVHRYSDEKTGTTKRVIINEVNYKSDAARYGTPTTFEYNNQAKAFKTLRDRYGITTTMRKWRGY